MKSLSATVSGDNVIKLYQAGSALFKVTLSGVDHKYLLNINYAPGVHVVDGAQLRCFGTQDKFNVGEAADKCTKNKPETGSNINVLIQPAEQKTEVTIFMDGKKLGSETLEFKVTDVYVERQDDLVSDIVMLPYVPVHKMPIFIVLMVITAILFVLSMGFLGGYFYAKKKRRENKSDSQKLAKGYGL